MGERRGVAARPEDRRADEGVPEDDAKLVTLARGARARADAAEGAAVLDDLGRSYAAGSVQLPGLELTAVQAAVAAAVSSGSRVLDSAAVVTSAAQINAADAALLGELGADRVLVVGLDGSSAVHPAP